MPLRKIIHIDMDAFYAAIEKLDRPELRGKPVVVGGSPSSRGVVCSASYEARVFGVRSAMGCFKAARLCPEANFVAPNFERYSEVSRRIQAIFREYTPLVEPLSLDEAYLDVTVNSLNESSATRLAHLIRTRIAQETGLTASAGIAPVKFAAKVASDRNKPNGQFVVTPADLPAFAAALPVGEVPGIGPVTAQYCQRLGIVLAGDFLRYQEIELTRLFGNSAAWYRAIAQGIDDRAVCPHHERRSVGVEETFAKDVLDRTQVESHLNDLAQQLAERLVKARTRARTLTLKVKYFDFRRVTRSRTLSQPMDRAQSFAAIAIDLMTATDIGQVPVRLLGLSASHLDDDAHHQQVLSWDVQTSFGR